MKDRRAEILEVAKTIFAERGVRQTTVREIGSRAGILSGSLYHHFASKLDIVDAILGEFCAEVLAHYRAIAGGEGDSIERLRAMSRYAVSLLPAHSAALVMMTTDAPELAREPRFRYLLDFDIEVEEHWTKVLQEGIAEGRVRADLDPSITYRFARDAIRGAIRWYEPTKSKRLEEIADQFSDILICGIQA